MRKSTQILSLVTAIADRRACAQEASITRASLSSSCSAKADSTGTIFMKNINVHDANSRNTARRALGPRAADREQAQHD